ncbi:hypothetical protein C8J57DRAFT_1345155 [Mycena rebaudengoi]|nr:hypothetical protein C8J57DRAFT_1345155 [Mycena rebaudengoi]
MSLEFDPFTAPPNSKWVPPTWVTNSKTSTIAPTSNGLSDSWDPLDPRFRGIDLKKTDPRLKIPSIEIKNDGKHPPIAFTDVNILDSTGAPPYVGDVLVQGQRISKVGGKLTAKDLEGARVFEGKGRTLNERHGPTTASLEGLADMPIEEHTLFSAKSAKTFLDCGYTMCRKRSAAGTSLKSTPDDFPSSQWAPPSARKRLDVVMKNAIQAGDIVGPRFLANGQEMAPFVETKEDIEKAVEELAELGADQAAHAHGIRVCSHARSDEAILQCLQYGVDIIYHGSFISDATMDALEAQKDRVFVVPAINWLVGTLQDATDFGYPVSKAEAVGYARELVIAIAGLKEMHRRGIKVITPHGTYRDLEHFVNLLGMTPMDAILSATAYGGEIMLHPHELGKVVPGAYADLILVNGNPLDDISLLSHKDNIDVIVMNGRVHKA